MEERRWSLWQRLVCVLTHTSVHTKWDEEELSGTARMWTLLEVRCGDCHRPLPKGARARCMECGQRTTRHQAPMAARRG